MRKVYLDELPKKGKYTDWKASVGCEISFEYDGIQGNLTIMEVYKEDIYTKFVVDYQGNQHHINLSNLTSGCIGKIVKQKKDEWHGYRVGQTIKDSTKNIILLKSKVVKHEDRLERGFHYKCLDCGHIGYKTIQTLDMGTGCKYADCRNKNKRLHAKVK